MPRTQVAAGVFHALAVSANGQVWAWGAQDDGALGNGVNTTADTGTPTRVCAPIAAPSMSVSTCPSGPYLENVVQVAAGEWKSWALTSDGAVYAWGANNGRQLGRGTSTTNSNRPVQVCMTASGATCTSYLDHVVAIAGGWDHVLALRDDGTLWAWGETTSRAGVGLNTGTSGVPLQVCSSQPSRVTTTSGCGGAYLTDVVAIEAEVYRAFAITSDGTLHGWGNNEDLRLGATTSWYSTKPTPVPGVSNVVSVASAPWHGMALDADGIPWTWGQGDYPYGATATYKLGRGNGTDSTTPVRPCAVASTGTGASCSAYVTNVVDIDTSYNTSLAMVGDGTVIGWGGNYYGTVGDGTNATSKARATVTCRRSSDGDCSQPLRSVVDVTTGVGTSGTGAYDRSETSYALHADGTISAWGLNNAGQLGNGSVAGSNPRAAVVEQSSGVPLDLDAGAGVHAVTDHAAGTSHSVQLRADGTVWTTGDNRSGQLGTGNRLARTRHAQVALVNAVDVAAGDDFSVALLADGTVRAWGGNASGQLGNGTTIASTSPVTVTGLPSPNVNAVAAIDAGGSTVIARMADGTVRTWGEGSLGQLGSGGTSDSSVPVTVASLGSVVSVAAGHDHALARLGDGTMRAWGVGAGGRLGVNSTSNSSTIVTVQQIGGGGSLGNVTRIDAGDDFSLARLADGTVVAWGVGGSGQLGDATSTNRLVPVQVVSTSGSGTLDRVSDISAGASTAYARRGDGTAVSWGAGARGQRSDNGTGATAAYPVSMRDSGGTSLVGATSVYGGGLVALLSGPEFLASAGANDRAQLGDCTVLDRVHVSAATYTSISGNAVNCAPSRPIDLLQRRHDATTAIPFAGSAAFGGAGSSEIVLRFTGSVDNPSPLTLPTVTPYVEVQEVGTPFSGTCGTTSSTVFAGTPVAIGATSTATTFTVRVGTLADEANYRWRACTSYAAGGSSAWSEAAEEHVGAYDFRVEYPAPSLTIQVGDDNLSTGPIASGADAVVVADLNVVSTDPDGYRLYARTDSDTNAMTCTSGGCSGTVPHWRGPTDSTWAPTYWDAADTRARAGLSILSASGTAPGSTRRMVQWGASATGAPAVWADSNYAAGHDNGANRLLHEHLAPTAASGDDIDLAWRVNAGVATQAGDYQTTITVIAVGGT